MAASLLEAFRYDETAAWAERLRVLAAEHRHPYYEAWGECLARCAAYRSGHAMEPDLELVEVTAAVGLKDMEALLCLNEAAVAWRAERLDDALALSRRVHQLWTESGWVWGALLARTLAAAAGEATTTEELASIGDRACEGPLPRVAVQTLGLLGRLWPEGRGRWAATARSMAATVPRARWDQRLEVISVAEALRWVGG